MEGYLCVHFLKLYFDYTQDMKMLKHELITFHRDEEGDLSTYTIKKIGGLKSPWAEEEEQRVYTVLGKKRKGRKINEH